MITVNLDKYLSVKYTVIYDLTVANRIVVEHGLASTFDEITFLASNNILNVPKYFFKHILQAWVDSFPDIDKVKSSLHIQTTNRFMKENFNKAITELLAERRCIDSVLHYGEKDNE